MSRITEEVTRAPWWYGVSSLKEWQERTAEETYKAFRELERSHNNWIEAALKRETSLLTRLAELEEQCKK